MTRLFATVAVAVSITAPALGQTQPRLRPRGATAAPSPAGSPSPVPRPLYQRGSTWYEFMLHELNPRDTDWGTWYERHRQALLDAQTALFAA